MNLDDQRWVGLQGGYRTAYDPRPALRALSSGAAPQPHWNDLWENLHHQDDVGEASYAAIPHIVGYLATEPLADWNGFSLAATIESVRHEPDNPPVPDWLKSDYETALQSLLHVALDRLRGSTDRDLTRCLIEAVAAAKGLPLLARVSIFAEDELREMLGA